MGSHYILSALWPFEWPKMKCNALPQFMGICLGVVRHALCVDPIFWVRDTVIVSLLAEMIDVGVQCYFLTCFEDELSGLWAYSTVG